MVNSEMSAYLVVLDQLLCSACGYNWNVTILYPMH